MSEETDQPPKSHMKNTLDIILKLVALIGIVFAVSAYLDSRYELRAASDFLGVAHSADLIIVPNNLPPGTETVAKENVDFPNLPARAKVQAAWIVINRGIDQSASLHYFEAVATGGRKVEVRATPGATPTSTNIHYKVSCAYSK
jgi:hypothetical protein